MLKDDELKKVAKGFAQHQQDHEYAVAAQAQSQISWDQVIRLLKDYDPEDADRERVIEECRRMGKATPALIRNVHKAFDMLGIVAKPQPASVSGASIRRKRVIQVAIEQALGERKGHKIREKRIEAINELEHQLDKGREDRALKLLRVKLWEIFEKAGRLIRDQYDIMTIEEAATFFSEDYVAAWHRAHDEGIAKEKEEAKKAANGGK
jgi:hypothetical protein